MEIKLIAENDATNPDKGYNLSRGGDGPDVGLMTAMWQNPEFKQDMCNRMHEAWKDPEKRKRRSDDVKNRWANEAFHQYATSKVTEACARPVVCVETNERFDVIKEAAKKYGVCSANISRSCKIGYRCGGYHWKYVDDVEKPNDYRKQTA